MFFRAGGGHAAACLVLGAALGLAWPCVAPAAQRGRERWQPLLLEQWLGAIERHVPGEVDSSLVSAASWSGEDLRQLWVDVQVLLAIAAEPKHTRFAVSPLEPGSPGHAAALTFRPHERAALDSYADRVRRLGPNTVVKRATIVHTDLVTLAPGMVTTSAAASRVGAPVRMLVGDGHSVGAESVSLHWALARRLLAQVVPDPRKDPFVRDWYRATVALGQSTEAFDTPHLRWALRALPDDPVLLMLAGCEREAFASPLFQAFAWSLRNAWLRPDIDSAGDELADAERFYRRALAVDADLVEARVRLGRVLWVQGRHAESARELRRSLEGTPEPVLAYYASLFLGAAQEALGDLMGARESFRRAADLVPDTRVPQLALARIARELGDRQDTAARLAKALAVPGDEGARDPWWRYRAAQGRRSMAWLDEVRHASRAASR